MYNRHIGDNIVGEHCLPTYNICISKQVNINNIEVHKQMVTFSSHVNKLVYLVDFFMLFLKTSRLPYDSNSIGHIDHSYYS